VGLTAAATRRAEQDRITVGVAYYYGRQKDPDSGDETTTVDNWFVAGKYDYFFTPQLYGFAGVRVERDRIADLNLRLTPSVGVGYQWYETPTFNLSTEAGIAWVYEDYEGRGSEDHFAARLAYHVDYAPHPAVLLFHNLEWLPSFESPIDDYNLNVDAGVRATLVSNLFAEFKVDVRQDSTPAPGREETDVRYLLSLGWRF
jgi:putative salt-induced outer membrane protein YdiY